MIRAKLAAKEALPPPAPPKQYITGEGFPYLGRFYRLLLVPSLDAPVNEESRTSQLSFLADDAAARPDNQVEKGEFSTRFNSPNSVLTRAIAATHRSSTRAAFARRLLPKWQAHRCAPARPQT